MNLLLVGPSALDREVYLSRLLDDGFRAKVADTVGSAMEMLGTARASRPDLIVLDLLPEPEQAWAFVRNVTSSLSAIPLVILTTLIRPDGANRRRALELGCAAFVARPCAPAQLVDIVRRVVAGERGLETVHYDRP